MTSWPGPSSRIPKRWRAPASSTPPTSSRLWLDTNGRAELQATSFPDVEDNPALRYRYFVHVDEESLESVVDDEKARDENAGYFCKVVFPDSVMIREQPRAAGEIPDPQDPLDEQLELLDCVKKIRFGHLVSLYRVTLDPNIWCYFQVEVDYDHVGIAVF